GEFGVRSKARRNARKRSQFGKYSASDFPLTLRGSMHVRLKISQSCLVRFPPQTTFSAPCINRVRRDSQSDQSIDVPSPERLNSSAGTRCNHLNGTFLPLPRLKQTHLRTWGDSPQRPIQGCEWKLRFWNLEVKSSKAEIT